MMRLDEVFDLRYGHSYELNALDQVEDPSGVNFVSRAMGNNGVTARVDVSPPYGSAGEVTVALSGNGVLSAFVQPEAFVTGFHVMILSAKAADMPLVEKLWWCRCIWENRYRYSWGRQANRTLGSLLVPDECPLWVLEKEIPSLAERARATSEQRPELDPAGWRYFRVKDVFEVSSGKYVPTRDKSPGATREVTSSAKNNGTSRFLDLRPNFEGGVISVARNGSVGTAFYQPEPFFATDDVRVWTARKGPLSAEEALFVCTVVEREQFRYSYGRKWSIQQMKDTRLRLPADKDGAPDWDFMTAYVRGLPFSGVVSGTA